MNCILGFHSFLNYVEIIGYWVYVIVATLILTFVTEECELSKFVEVFVLASYVVLIIWTCDHCKQKKIWEQENL